jgi:hypothetical protein
MDHSRTSRAGEGVEEVLLSIHPTGHIGYMRHDTKSGKTSRREKKKNRLSMYLKGTY